MIKDLHVYSIIVLANILLGFGENAGDLIKVFGLALILKHMTIRPIVKIEERIKRWRL